MLWLVSSRNGWWSVSIVNENYVLVQCSMEPGKAVRFVASQAQDGLVAGADAPPGA
jgi:hypothetical protein